MRKVYSQNCLLALDAGTTGVKGILFGGDERVLSRGYVPLRKSSPREDFVEQDPREILAAARGALCLAVSESGVPVRAISGLGITNQRETTILWDRRTGEPIYPAIVWEDRRTKDLCDRLARDHGGLLLRKTGLNPDSYFSASKIKWMLDSVPNVRAQAERGELCFGTVDTWLLWNLVKERPHITDVTNASRTLLFNIHTKEWDTELCVLFGIPPAVLPLVLPSASSFGELSPGLLGGSIPVSAVAGDQQASLYAAGVKRGTTKVTFGTGIFIMQIVGGDFQTHPPFITTLTAGREGQSFFAIEAKIESCAECVTPIIGRESELSVLLEDFAAKVARFVDVLPHRPEELVIDGGVTQAPYLRQAIERMTRFPVREHAIFDGTALGIARLARAAS